MDSKPKSRRGYQWTLQATKFQASCSDLSRWPNWTVSPVPLRNYKGCFLEDSKFLKYRQNRRWEEFVAAIEHLTDIIRHQQNKQWKILTLAQLHLDYTKEKQGLALYQDQRLKWQMIFSKLTRKKMKKTRDDSTSSLTIQTNERGLTSWNHWNLCFWFLLQFWQW